jgi:cell wall-associated NlpC family hydrolase
MVGVEGDYINNIIAEYVGRKYQYNGRGEALDCLGLVISFLNDNGIYLPNDDGDPIQKDWYADRPLRLVNGLSQHGRKINNPEELQPLDVVVFSFRGIPRHVGVMTDKSHFIHAREGKKVAIIRLKHYKRFLHSCWRVR